MKPAPSTGRTIAVAGAIWGASLVLSRLVGLAREVVVGRTLGTSAEGDLWQAAFTIPDFLNYLLAGGALTVVYLPIAARYVANGDVEGGQRSFQRVWSFLATLLVLATAALWVLAPHLLDLVAPGMGGERHEQLAQLVRILLPAQIFHVLGGLVSAWLQARDKHAAAATAPLLYTLAIIAGGLLGGTVEGFCWGALAGSFLGPFLVPTLAARRAGLRLRFECAPRDSDLRAYVVRSLPVMVGFSIVVADEWFQRREGALLFVGAVAVLGYARTLLRVPLGAFGFVAGVATYPVVARHVAAGEHDAARTLVRKAVRTMLFVGAGSALALWCAAPQAVELLLGARRTTPEHAQAVVAAVRAGAFGLAAWTAQPLLSRGFYALGLTWPPALLGTLLALCALPLYPALRASHGVAGVAAAGAIAIVAYATLLHLWLEREWKKRGAARPDGLPLHLARLAGALLLAAWPADALARRIDGLGWPAALELCAIGGASVLLYAAAAALLRLAELETLREMLQRRLRRR